MSKILVLLAGGSGERMGAGQNKVFLSLGGKTCLQRSLEAFCGLVNRLILVVRPEEEEKALAIYRESALDVPFVIAHGGSTRQASVLSGLQSVSFAEDDWVLIHDAARCFVPRDVIRRVLDACLEHGSGVPSVPVTDTVREVLSSGQVGKTLDRSRLQAAQTPQGFHALSLLRALQQAAQDGFEGTDDASIMAHAGYPVFVTAGDRKNLKLTTREDLIMAQAMLQNSLPLFRVGQGYDVHRLVQDRKLILCGVEIPHTLGLLGHSDADVALHALMDAMLGAAALGDIGHFFPDTDPQYRGISSLLLLKKTNELLRERLFSVSNADITIVAQRPKLAPYIPQMKENVAEALSLPVDRISVKATTTEKLGFEGSEEGISAQAVCLIQSSVSYRESIG